MPTFMDSIQIIPCPMTVVDVQHTLRYTTLRLSTEYYLKRTYLQCVDVAILKFTLLEGNHLKIDVISADNGMDVIDCHEVLR
jgi:hypothetical protein